MTNNQKTLLENIRNTSYKQGYGRLRPDENTFCFSGLVVDTFHKMTGEGEWLELPDRWCFNICDYGYENLIETGILKYFGISRKQSNELFKMNDSYKLTFKQIAIYLEVEWNDN